MKAIRFFLTAMMFCIGGLAAAQTDSNYLYGIHWWKTGGDPEAMSGGKALWILEQTFTDTAPAGNNWEAPGTKQFLMQNMTSAGNTVVARLHPNWSRNVPHASDPYTLANYTTDAQSAADTLKNLVHIWQVGNEVNINGENYYWNGSDYGTLLWTPTPEQYAAVYEAVRDAIHLVTPNTTPATQYVLMQPVSPGNEITLVRYMDGNEFLWRQIEGVSDPAKIDGFALHSYAEPGGSNFGVDGWMDALREQIMIIDQLGLHDRPLFITEFNKHMPVGQPAEANIGAKFLHRSYTALNAWNNGTGGAWPGVANHDVVGAMWFVYPGAAGWDDYALEYWKTNIVSTDHELNPWYSFQYASGLNYAKGSYSGGGAVSMSDMWWQDEFNGASLDSANPLPDWKVETSGSGSVAMTGSGQVRFLGNGSVNGGGGIRTSGYVFGNFHLETEIVFTNANRANASPTEGNFDLRLREGSKGYSITFFTSQSAVNTNRVILRRTNDWTQIGSFNTLVSGGINSGDVFRINATADGDNIDVKIYKNGSVTPAVDWAITDSGQNVGWLRLMTYNLNEARVNYVRMGGPQWSGVPLGVDQWTMY